MLRYLSAPFDTMDVPLHGRWTATDDTGSVYRGFGNGAGGGAGGWFGDLTFAPALRSDATSLRLQLHQPGDTALVEAMLSLPSTR